MQPQPRWCLMVIDMQPFFLGSLPDETVARLLERHMSLLLQCRAQNIPVINVEYNPGQYGTTTLSLLSLMYGMQVAHIPKTQRSAFTCPVNREKLLKQLTTWGITHIIVTGVYGKYCVLATGEDAMNADYDVVFDTTAIASDTTNWETETYPHYEKIGQISRYEDVILSPH